MRLKLKTIPRSGKWIPNLNSALDEHGAGLRFVFLPSFSSRGQGRCTKKVRRRSQSSRSAHARRNRPGRYLALSPQFGVRLAAGHAPPQPPLFFWIGIEREIGKGVRHGGGSLRPCLVEVYYRVTGSVFSKGIG
jgi:hypothetical protein